MSVIDTLVTDRKKGAAYNAADLNRVESAVRYLADALNAAPTNLKAYASGLSVAWDKLFDMPYGIISVTTKTDWAMRDTPRREDMERYLGNVKTVKGALDAIYPPLPDSMESLTYTDANYIEYALIILRDALEAEIARVTALLDKTAAAWYYTGDLYAGEL